MTARSLGDEFRSRRDAVEARYGMHLRQSQASRVTSIAIGGTALALYVFGLVMLDVSPVRLWNGAGRLFDLVVLMLPPTPGTWEHFHTYLGALGQTLAIAFLGTLLAGILAVPFGFLAARNVVANRVLHLLTRRGMDTVRSIDTLIWALIWIDVVGLGPFAGALAIASSDFGALAKLMSEAIEDGRRTPVEG